MKKKKPSVTITKRGAFVTATYRNLSFTAEGDSGEEVVGKFKKWLDDTFRPQNQKQAETE
jgi:hypothetical protein